MLVIALHSFYRDCLLIFLGFLFTTSPTVGFNYMDLGYERYIDIPSNAYTVHPEYSALDSIRKRWETHGTTSWGMKSVPWLMVILIIELEVAPHGDHLRKNIPDIKNAYLPIVRDLVSTIPSEIFVAH